MSTDTATRDPWLDNRYPIDDCSPEFEPLFRRLQGNIVKSHGRNITANLFLQFHMGPEELRALLRWLAQGYVTDAFTQHRETEAYRKEAADARGPLPPRPSPFGALLLRPGAYRKLNYTTEELCAWFADPREGRDPRLPQRVSFLGGMHSAAEELGDPTTRPERPTPLEEAYRTGTIDALLLLADDVGPDLRARVAVVLSELTRRGAEVVAQEWGHVLRDGKRRRIEPFGYADGISQPLFLAMDFPRDRCFKSWDPFAPLSRVLFQDPVVRDRRAWGSYYVFRKLEQDVARFHQAEADLAKALGLDPGDAARAGAMIIGRFRDGTPLALSQTPADAGEPDNDFRYDGLDVTLRPVPPADPLDRLGLKCPFQAHVRKMSPRQSVATHTSTVDAVEALEKHDRSRAIARRGIPYGLLDASGCPVSEPGTAGLLFASYQRSVIRQFAFLQKRWANQPGFLIAGQFFRKQTGLDPIIGKPIFGTPPGQFWRAPYGGDPCQPDPPDLSMHLNLGKSHPVNTAVGDFVHFRGGEFFFAPSLTFLLGEST